MPQAFFPIFPNAVVHINANLAFKKEDNGRVYYFNGHESPLFSHAEDDMQSFKMIISQFYVNGIAKQAELVKAFGIPPITMKRAVKIFREKGPAGFFNSNQPKRKPRVLKPEIIAEAQKLLDEGKDAGIVSLQLGLKKDTVQKAIRDGRLKKKTLPNQVI